MDLASTGTIGATTSLRALNIAGALPCHPDPDETWLIPRVMAVQRGTAPELVVNGDGDAIRDFVHVADMAEAFALALDTCELGAARVHNIGSGRPTRVRTVINMVERVTGRGVRARGTPGARRRNSRTPPSVDPRGSRRSPVARGACCPCGNGTCTGDVCLTTRAGPPIVLSVLRMVVRLTPTPKGLECDGREE
jgi:hypothetical protein